MEEIRKAVINLGGTNVGGVLLAVYTREHYALEKTFIERIFFKKTKSRIKTVMKKTYLVFIPWKHKMKEIAEVTEENTVSVEEGIPSEWIFVPEFTSRGSEEYPSAFTVKDFHGYPFIYDNGSFICDEISGEHERNLEILYSEMPWLTDMETDGSTPSVTLINDGK